MPPQVHVIGASGRSGTALCAALAAAGIPAIPVIRNAAKWQFPISPRLADLTNPPALKAALSDATSIVSCAHARHAPAILQAAPKGATFIFLGSTRKFTNWPDAHGSGVLAGEAAFLASGRPGLMLHPTMIYGATGEDNVQRLAALLKRLTLLGTPIVPLPAGGRALVQPIHQSDVTSAVLAALAREWPTPTTIVIAGPTPLPYADFVGAIAHAAALPPPRIIPVPAPILMAAATLTRLPFLPTITANEIRRLLEDKAFDITAMRTQLGIDPISLAQGLARTFPRNPPIPPGVT
jgi:nucleoside-diphosphate-sugar epimerase